MSVNLSEMIQERMRVLSEEEMQQVLTFVNSLLTAKRTRHTKSISAMFEELSSEIPFEEWRELPSDGAENHDHYLYGAAKTSK